jgi:hypothetical protein
MPTGSECSAGQEFTPPLWTGDTGTWQSKLSPNDGCRISYDLKELLTWQTWLCEGQGSGSLSMTCWLWEAAKRTIQWVKTERVSLSVLAHFYSILLAFDIYNNLWFCFTTCFDTDCILIRVTVYFETVSWNWLWMPLYSLISLETSVTSLTWKWVKGGPWNEEGSTWKAL